MARDAIKNLLKVKVVGTYSNSDTTIEIDSDDFSRLPNPATAEYNLVWWDIENYPDPSDDPNVEIVRVQSSDSGTKKITVQRGQEDTIASAKTGELILMLALTKKTLTDIFGEIDGKQDEMSKATSSDINTGSDNAKYVTSAGLSGSKYPQLEGATAIEVINKEKDEPEEDTIYFILEEE